MPDFIRYDKLRDFSRDLQPEDVWKDLQRYHVQNIAQKTEDFCGDYYDDAMNVLLRSLYDDYDKKMLNYMAYIDDGMDLRFMMELRKSALLPISDPKLIPFYAEHSKCKTIQDIKNLRLHWLSFLNDYADLDWQIWLIIRRCWGIRSKGIQLDFEFCYADCNGSWSTPESYWDDFLRQHLPEDKVEEWSGFY